MDMETPWRTRQVDCDDCATQDGLAVASGPTVQGSPSLRLSRRFLPRKHPESGYESSALDSPAASRPGWCVRAIPLPAGSA